MLPVSAGNEMQCHTQRRLAMQLRKIVSCSVEFDRLFIPSAASDMTRPKLLVSWFAVSAQIPVRAQSYFR